jgi:hypothetical protein
VRRRRPLTEYEVEVRRSEAVAARAAGRRYVPDLAAHRAFDEATMARARARHCDQGRHAWITGNLSGVVDGPVQTWCSICDTPRVGLEQVQWVLPHPGGVTWAVCDKRALWERTPLVLAGPFGTFSGLRAAVLYYRETTADFVTVRVADAETWIELCDPIAGPRLLRDALGLNLSIETAVEVPA